MARIGLHVGFVAFLLVFLEVGAILLQIRLVVLDVLFVAATIGLVAMDVPLAGEGRERRADDECRDESDEPAGTYFLLPDLRLQRRLGSAPLRVGPPAWTRRLT